MGKKYYCDYCGVHIQRDPSIVKKHKEGITHIRIKAAYFESLKDPNQILKESLSKKPCRTLQSSQECSFGAICHFNHYRPDELRKLREQAQLNHDQKLKRNSDIIARLAAADTIVKKFVANRQTKTTVSTTNEIESFWFDPEPQTESDLPPSLRAIDPTCIKLNQFSSWG
ncbi:zinc finger matrin-type protein 5 [Wyeomyia smithii]|uniref:zinc finger matrin-type protein 5 n=1 Tax=Wyeomyia smithii TaxID=174621 RepID=UPI002467BD23|nr:zinc finger matrin-type protein 5 [Wyeomyia smithii]